MKQLLPKQRRPTRDGNGAVPTSRSLSPNTSYVFDCAWRMGHGTIRGLHVRDGDCELDPPFFLVRKACLSKEAWPRRQSGTADYALKREHIRFLEELRAIGAGVVDVKVVAGLPVALDIWEQP